MRIGLGITSFFFFSQAAIVVIALDNWHNHLFLPDQMMGWWQRTGVPSIAHGGLWFDIFLLPYVICFMLGNSGEWSLERDWPFIALGIGIAVANQFLCNNMTRSDPLGFVDLQWSLAIVVHFVYMAAYIAIIGHFYFNPADVSASAIVLTSILLGVHVAAGTHVFLGMANLLYNWSWCTDLLADKMLPYMNAGVWLLLAGLATVAAGWRAGLSVATIGVVLAMTVVLFVRASPPLDT